MITEISFQDIKPHVRLIQTVYTTKTFSPTLFRSYSQRIYFIKSGSCTIVVDGVSYAMKKYSLIFIRSGSTFMFVPDNTDVLSFSVIFSFTSDNPEWEHLPDSPRIENFREEYPRERMRFTDTEYFNHTVCLHNMHCVKSYFNHCASEFILKKLHHNDICAGLLNVILHLIKRNYELHGNSAAYDKKENYVDAIIEFIHNNYNHNISNEIIGKAFNLHPNYINKLILERTSYSLHRYVNSVRIEAAIKLFTSTEMSISEVANAVGYSDSSYFSRYFKQITGKSPSYYHNN